MISKPLTPEELQRRTARCAGLKPCQRQHEEGRRIHDDEPVQNFFCVGAVRAFKTGGAAS